MTNLLQKPDILKQDSWKVHGRNADKQLHQASYTTNQINEQIQQMQPVGTVSLNSHQLEGTLGQPRYFRDSNSMMDGARANPPEYGQVGAFLGAQEPTSRFGGDNFASMRKKQQQIQQQTAPLRPGLQQPKKVTIVRNNSIELDDNKNHKSNNRTRFRNNNKNASYSSGEIQGNVSRRFGRGTVDNNKTQLKPITAFGSMDRRRQRSGTNKRVSFSPRQSTARDNSEGGQREHPEMTRQPQSRSRSRSKSGSRSNPRVRSNIYETSAKKTESVYSAAFSSNFQTAQRHRFSGARSSSNKPKMSKNSQIQFKFMNQEKEMNKRKMNADEDRALELARHLRPDLSFKTDQVRSTKAILDRMKQLSMQRRLNMPSQINPYQQPLGKENVKFSNNISWQKNSTPQIRINSAMKAKEVRRNLQTEYDERKRRLSAKIYDQVKKNITGPGKIKVKAPKNMFSPELNPTISESEVSFNVAADNRNKDLDLEPTRERSLKKLRDQDTDPDKLKAHEQLMDYARSKRALQDRIEQDQVFDKFTLQNQKTELIQELNRRLVELDRINEDKRNLNTELIHAIRFVVDLQTELGTADNSKISEVIDKGMEAELRLEKQHCQEIRERIKKCQNEKDELIQQLMFFQKEKEVTVMTKHGNQIDFQKVNMKLEDMLIHWERVRNEIAANQREMDELTFDPEAMNQQIDRLTQDVDLIASERMDLAENLRALQERYDQVIFQNQCDLRDIGYDFRFRNHRSLALVMRKALRNAVKGQMRRYLSDLIHRQKNEQRQIQSILGFRRVCYNYEERRLKKYIQYWFQQALKPMQEKVHGKRATKFQTQNDFIIKFLTKWDHQRLISVCRSSRQIQQISNFHECFDRYYKREQRHAFDLWRANTFIKRGGSKTLRRFFFRMNYMQKQQALLLWKQRTLEQNLSIKLQGHAINVSFLQYKQALFTAWRMQVRDLKTIKYSLQLRAFKALQKNRQFSHLRKLQGILLIKTQNHIDDHLVQICFRALKLNKEQEKHQKVFDRLHLQEIPASIETCELIDRTRQKAHLVASKRAVRNGVVNPFSRVLHSYFEHWREVNKNYKVRLNKNIKDKILSRYKSRLADAWTRWNQKTEKKKRKKRKIINNEISGGITSKERELADLNQRIKAEQVRSGNNRNKKFRVMLLKAYHSELRFRLRQWRAILEENDEKAQIVDRTVIRKIHLRKLRRAFNHFNNQTKKLQRTLVKIEGADEIFAKYRFIQTRRIYNAWHALMKNDIAARGRLKKLLDTYNKKHEKHHFNLWQRSLENKKQKKLKKRQKMMTETLQGKADEQGHTEDVNFQKEQKIAEQVRSGRKFGHKTVRKYIARWRDSMYRDAFSRWKLQTALFKKAKSGIGQSFFVRIFYRRQQDAFMRWRKIIFDADEKQAIVMHGVEVDLEKKQAERLRASRTRIAQIREQSAYDLQELQEIQRVKKIRKMKVVEKLIKETMNNYVVPKQHQIFFAWREIASTRAKYLRKLVDNLHKNHQQRGFDSIVEADRSYLKLNSTEKKLHKFFRGYERGHTRLAFTLWKQDLFKRAKDAFAGFDEAEFHALANSNHNREDILKKRTQMLWSGNANNTLKFTFEELRKYAKRRAFQRGQFQKSTEKLIIQRMKFGLKRWLLNAHEQRVMEEKKRRACNLFDRLVMIRSMAALKQECLKNYKLKKLLKQIYVNGAVANKKYALKEIINFASTRGDQSFTQKQLGAKKMLSLMAMGDKRNLKIWFDQMLSKGRKKYMKEIKIRGAFKKTITKNQRAAFLKWKKLNEFLTVEQDQNECGPTRMQERMISQDAKNLQRMLKDKMIVNNEELKQIILKDKRKYRKGVEKALCRLLLHGDGKSGYNDDWIKPWCVDKWKQFVAERKSYRHWINHLNVLAESRQVATLKQAFDRWNKGQIKLREHLQKQTTEYLKDRSYKNGHTLFRQAQQIESLQNEATDLKTQREYLIDKVVSGQRLALARCRFSFSFAQQRAWQRFLESGASGMRDKFDAALLKALAEIKKNKQQIEELEEENTDISEQNEGLREGALEGVESLREMQKLQGEVADLNGKLTKQADEVRKLLMKNKELQKKVREAEAKVPKKGPPPKGQKVQKE